jgi:hypothetical protein
VIPDRVIPVDIDFLQEQVFLNPLFLKAVKDKPFVVVNNDRYTIRIVKIGDRDFRLIEIDIRL